ncbi:hypothetical protein SeF6b_073 [Salmonella phage SeF6b]|nr:hypothetical protein SeF6b_073 [Salmonella phage SeF6b]
MSHRHILCTCIRLAALVTCTQNMVKARRGAASEGYKRITRFCNLNGKR